MKGIIALFAGVLFVFAALFTGASDAQKFSGCSARKVAVETKSIEREKHES
jgi:hypothetical protein